MEKQLSELNKRRATGKVTSKFQVLPGCNNSNACTRLYICHIFFFIYFNHDYKINEAILSDPNYQVSENKRYGRGHYSTSG